MSDSSLKQALLWASSGVSLVLPEMLSAFVGNAQMFFDKRFAEDENKAAEVTSAANLEVAYGFFERHEGRDEKPFVYQDGIAVIPVHGTLLNRFNSSWGYVTGYGYVRRVLNAALSDPDVEVIVLDINSPGGEAAGNFELAREIRQATETKPVLAMIDSIAASGGLSIAVSCTRVYAIPSAAVGSIGAYRMHVDYSENLKQAGIKVTFAKSGEHKVDGNPYEPIGADVLADWVSDADEIRANFAELVAEMRGIDLNSVLATEGRVYSAKEALDLGLIDEVKTTTEAIAAFVAWRTDHDIPDELENEQMSDQTSSTAAAASLTAEQVAEIAAKAAAAAIAADREEIRKAQATADARAAEISALPEGSDKPKLVAALVADPAISAAQAKIVLAAAAPEATSTSTQGGSVDTTNHLAAAMADTGSTGDIGSGDGAGQMSDDAKGTKALIESFVAAGGKVKAA